MNSKSKKRRAAAPVEEEDRERPRLMAAAERPPRISPETKKSIAAVAAVGAAVFLLLARAGSAGPAGRFIYSGLDHLLGWGYYLLPLMAAVIALVFLIEGRQTFLSTPFVGAAAVIIFSLGIIDIIFPSRGGLIGNIIGALEIPFSYTGGLVLTGSLALIALLITLNAKIKILTAEPTTDDDVEEPINAPDDKEQATETNASAIPKTAAANLRRETEPEIEPEFEFKIKDRKKAIIQAKNYVAPPLSLLKTSVEKPTGGDLRANANIIKRTLESFGIPVEMGEISIGPKVTRYTLKPAEGIKLTRITALNQDLALALAAHPIRIEAPIPGKSLVGIEVPNKASAIVRLGSLIGYPEFGSSGPLNFILGRDVTGEPIMSDIERMPHLLIAGSTGSGKSVAIHSLIVSLLYKNSPESLRFILIDPKRVELSHYNGISHLITPVITDGKKAVGVFRWAIQEMERRYEVLLSASARDIKSYNKNRRGNAPLLPYLIIIVDELADLMTSFGREVEVSIVRLAQMARATGLHLVVATQRPSVEVITGLIKANITSRIALQVASQIDSRTILDSAGAEKLLGGGDMLFISPEYSKPKRIQGAYISEEEINKVVGFIADNNREAETAAQSIEQTVQSMREQPDFDQFSGSDEDDELYQEAVEAITQAQKASASLLQRRLKIGYARAARLLDIMEAKGVVGPGEGAKPREVFLSKSADQNFDRRDFE